MKCCLIRGDKRIDILYENVLHSNHKVSNAFKKFSSKPKIIRISTVRIRIEFRLEVLPSGTESHVQLLPSGTETVQLSHVWFWMWVFFHTG